ncbi:AAA family ATPase [Rhodobacteraceae bacterium]|nr:AAA family ATPase [Paracoccaceae bacterium]
MGLTLEQVAEQLHNSEKKVQLIYAFNGTGKTRLSRAFRDKVAPKSDLDDTTEDLRKILYYNAFTEDLFFWDNDLDGDANRVFKIQPNEFTNWILEDQGQDQNIITQFQKYADPKLTPRFNKDFSEVTFSFDRGDDTSVPNCKISKGEESLFIWSVFYAILEAAIATINIPELDDRDTNQFNDLEYVFIDDPVSSLDENHLIELAVTLAKLVESAPSDLKFIITTHNPLFYNVLHSELELNKGKKRDGCYLLESFEDGTFQLQNKYGGTNTSFPYHLHVKNVLENAINTDCVERFHFTLIRNLYEKTASFLGYERWSQLLESAVGGKDVYVRRINTFSHSSLSADQVRDPTPQEKQTVKFLLEHLINNYGYSK